MRLYVKYGALKCACKLSIVLWHRSRAYAYRSMSGKLAVQMLKSSTDFKTNVCAIVDKQT